MTAAYISPDTVMIREIGSVSFKAIPEDKPLEVMFMAPELQQKGILNEQVTSTPRTYSQRRPRKT